MIKIGNDLIILKSEDLLRNYFCEECEDSLTGFNISYKKYYNVNLVVFKTNTYFIILKSRFDFVKLGLNYGVKYDINNYSKFLGIYYLMINNKNMTLELAKKEVENW